MARARLGIGVIGLGRHGLRYAQHLLTDFPGARLAGFTRRDAAQGSRDAKTLGAPFYRDHRELLAAPDVDAVAVVVPPALHLEILLAALERGKPVLLEKPAAVHLKDGKRMLQATRKAGVPVMVAQTMRYNETVARLREERGRIGRLHSIRISQRFEPSPTSWVHDPALAGRGTMLHTGIHGFDLLRFLSGMEADRVSAEIATVASGPLDDTFSALLRLGESTTATVSGCRATSGRTGALEMVGEQGQLVADHVLRKAMLVSGKAVTEIPLPDPVSTVACVIEGFCRALHDATPPPIPLEEGLRSLALVEAAYASAQSGAATPVESLEE